jgi:hypothetical protein
MALRNKSESAAIMNLLSKVDPAKFESNFGTNIANADSLI